MKDRAEKLSMEGEDSTDGIGMGLAKGQNYDREQHKTEALITKSVVTRTWVSRNIFIKMETSHVLSIVSIRPPNKI